MDYHSHQVLQNRDLMRLIVAHVGIRDIVSLSMVCTLYDRWYEDFAMRFIRGRFEMYAKTVNVRLQDFCNLDWIFQHDDSNVYLVQDGCCYGNVHRDMRQAEPDWDDVCWYHPIEIIFPLAFIARLIEHRHILAGCFDFSEFECGTCTLQECDGRHMCMRSLEDSEEDELHNVQSVFPIAASKHVIIGVSCTIFYNGERVGQIPKSKSYRSYMYAEENSWGNFMSSFGDAFGSLDLCSCYACFNDLESSESAN